MKSCDKTLRHAREGGHPIFFLRRGKGWKEVIGCISLRINRLERFMSESPTIFLVVLSNIVKGSALLSLGSMVLKCLCMSKNILLLWMRFTEKNASRNGTGNGSCTGLNSLIRHGETYTTIFSSFMELLFLYGKKLNGMPAFAGMTVFWDPITANGCIYTTSHSGCLSLKVQESS